jgi:hypothetical protein
VIDPIGGLVDVLLLRTAEAPGGATGAEHRRFRRGRGTLPRLIRGTLPRLICGTLPRLIRRALP